MKHRERLLAALSHEQPDKVPLDLGGTNSSSIVLEGYDKLKQHFGVESRTKAASRWLRIAEVDEPIAGRLDIDTRGVFLGPSLKRKDQELGPNQYRDLWGIERVQPEHSYYYDQRISPLRGEITLADIVNYPWPDPDDAGFLHGLKERVAWLKKETDCAVCLSLPPPFIHISQFIRGFEDWYCDMAGNAKLLEALFDAVLDVNLEISRRALLEVGRDLDVVFCGDDVATQNGLQYSHEYYLRYIQPRHKKYFRQVHDLSPAKLVYHSCGSVVNVIEDLIEIGVDALNPVQVTATGMDPAELKKKYRGRLAFWGAIDSQKTLPQGSVNDVKKMVEERIEQMGEGGGYVLSSVHNIQPDVPLENVLAMFRHAREYLPSFCR